MSLLFFCHVLNSVGGWKALFGEDNEFPLSRQLKIKVMTSKYNFPEMSIPANWVFFSPPMILLYNMAKNKALSNPNSWQWWVSLDPLHVIMNSINIISRRRQLLSFVLTFPNKCCHYNTRTKGIFQQLKIPMWLLFYSLIKEKNMEYNRLLNFSLNIIFFLNLYSKKVKFIRESL